MWKKYDHVGYSIYGECVDLYVYVPGNLIVTDINYNVIISNCGISLSIIIVSGLVYLNVYRYQLYLTNNIYFFFFQK